MTDDVDVPGLVRQISSVYGVPLVLVARHFGEPTPGVPKEWQPVLAASTRREVVAEALALWPQEIRDLFPEFWRVFSEDLHDVAVVRREGQMALLYVLRAQFADGSWDVRGMFGYPPYDDPREPLGWGLHPDPVRRFLTDVHGGFTTEDGESLGYRRPADWVTLAEYVGHPDGHPGLAAEPEEQRHLYVFGAQDFDAFLCVSPDATRGTATYVFDFYVEAEDYSLCVDRFLWSGAVRPAEQWHALGE